jgi:hypothetical protein
VGGAKKNERSGGGIVCRISKLLAKLSKLGNYETDYGTNDIVDPIGWKNEKLESLDMTDSLQTPQVI